MPNKWQISPNELRQFGCVHICSWKPESKATNPNVFTFFPLIKSDILFMTYCPPSKKQSQKCHFKDERDRIYSWSQKDFHSKSRYLAKPKRLLHNEGMVTKASRWRGEDCFEVRGTTVLLSGQPVISSQSVSQASSGYQAVCYSVA